MALKAVDLFAGAGGLSKGLEEAGFKIVVANEKQKDAVLTYRYNHPQTKMIEGDILEIAESELIPSINGEIDLVAAGPPCQGFSLAGRRDINDKRNVLFKELVRIVSFVRPKMFLMENVKGLLSMDNGRIIKSIERAFTNEGYIVRTFVLNAAWFGVPQYRERVFIIGRRDGVQPTEIEIPALEETSVGEAISDLDFIENGESSTVYRKRAESNYQVIMRMGVKRNSLKNHEATLHNRSVTDRFSQFKQGQTMKDIPSTWQTKKLMVYRLDRTKPSRTLTTLPEDFIHYSKNRIPTVREYARIQSFPDSYVFLGPKSTGGLRRRKDVPQYSQVGNAVPPLLGRAVGLYIKNQLCNYYQSEAIAGYSFCTKRE
jgi:DNA (cytosine-5)-methyltransferase 1